MTITNLYEEPSQTVTVPTIKYYSDRAGAEPCEEPILREHRLEIYVNEALFASLVCTGTDLTELVLGRLATERVITSADDVESLYLCESGNRARVFLKKEISLRPAAQPEPSCCTDNRIYLEPEETAGIVELPTGNIRNDDKTEKNNQNAVNPARKMDDIFRENIFSLINAFADDSRLHRTTRGAHSCVLSYQGEIVYTAEDLGRHNALDKAVGYAILHEMDPADCILFTTGRVPTDMVRKVIAARIPVLVSKAVPTDAAVELAHAAGLTLICRAWPDSCEIF